MVEGNSKDRYLTVLHGVNKEILDNWREKREEILNSKISQALQSCLEIFEIGGLSINSQDFLSKYGNEPIRLLRQFVEESVTEGEEAYIQNIIDHPDENAVHNVAGADYEGLARLFHYYGLDFVGDVLPSGEFNKPDSGGMFVLFGLWNKLTKKLCKKMCADFEEAIREKHFKEQSA